jgi:tRNA threonylcarbamoyladenosine biosynthesis protein TsaB
MLILTIRTDKPEAEIGLFNNTTKLDYQTWHAHRELSATLHTRISELLAKQGKTIQDLRGIAAFQGPGSFTGLRIGLTVANTLAYSLSIPIVAAQGAGWLETALQRLVTGESDQIALPHYGAEAHITLPKAISAQ